MNVTMMVFRQVILGLPNMNGSVSSYKTTLPLSNSSLIHTTVFALVVILFGLSSFLYIGSPGEFFLLFDGLDSQLESKRREL